MQQSCHVKNYNHLCVSSFFSPLPFPGQEKVLLLACAHFMQPQKSLYRHSVVYLQDVRRAKESAHISPQHGRCNKDKQQRGE